jgi:hypothetical protein
MLFSGYGRSVRVTHRVGTKAGADEVWAALGDPTRWPEHDVLVDHVECVRGKVREGQHLVVVTRGLRLRIPVDVRLVVPGRHLGLTVRTAPGLTHEIDVMLTPRPGGGAQVRVQVLLAGVFARWWWLPEWTTRAVSTRLLARRSRRADDLVGTRSAA